ncbi:MAG: ATP-binding protein [Rhodocyclales bacterium]|nr:ATP-binding protein [Rhodocyclales bacterium]
MLDRLELIHAPVAIDSGTRLYVAPSRATIFADELLLSRIVGNFISNGLKYARGGTVAVVARRRRDHIVIEVRDNGPGIPLAEQQHIFEEFYQLDNPTRDSQRGFGLGLATARRIAGLIGAQIGLRSQTGRGSVFSVALPREASTTPMPPPVAAESG